MTLAVLLAADGAKLLKYAAFVGGGLVVIGLAGIGGLAPSLAGVQLASPLSAFAVTQRFGCTPFELEPFDAACASRHFHAGVDLAAALGTPVFAATAGRASVVSSTTGYGLHVVVEAGGGVEVLYGHLSAVSVPDGGEVSAGSQLGAVGSTGSSTGPHLHFEVRQGGVPVDPTPWLPAGGPYSQGGSGSWSTRSS